MTRGMVDRFRCLLSLGPLPRRALLPALLIIDELRFVPFEMAGGEMLSDVLSSSTLQGRLAPRPPSTDRAPSPSSGDGTSLELRQTVTTAIGANVDRSLHLRRSGQPWRVLCMDTGALPMHDSGLVQLVSESASDGNPS